MTPQERAPRLQEQAVDAGPRSVRRLLDGRGCARRQRATVLPGGAAPPRDAPLRHRAAFIHAFLEAGNPLWRSETKTKEGWGTLSRDGTGDGPQGLKALDPAVPSRATGVRMPPGLDDRARHQGWMQVGSRRATTAFACESVRVLWHNDGQRLAPNAAAICLLGDGGGRNSGHTPRCQEALQGVGKDWGGPLRVAHSPAYCAPCHPIERRLVSHVTSAGQGVLFDARHTGRGLLQQTKTPQGLSGTVRVLETLSASGRTVTEAFTPHRPIVFAKLRPQWTSWALPQ